MNKANNTQDPPSNHDVTSRYENPYIAFCDILGFSNRILSDFDDTLELYRGFGRLISEMPNSSVRTTVYSDAILLTSNSLADLLGTVQSLWFFALGSDLMLRGAIAKGRYWEERNGPHFLVASEALVRCVKLEKSIGIPAVVLADDIDIPDDYWLTRFTKGPLVTPLLHFRDRNIVNPFNVFWFRSAGTRATQLMSKSPAHKDKYLWFLALHKAVGDNRELIPQEVLARLLAQGVLRATPSGIDGLKDAPEKASSPQNAEG